MQQLLQLIKNNIKLNQVRTGLSWVFLIAILYQVAVLTWSIIERFVTPPPPIAKPVVKAQQSINKSKSTNMRAVANMHLFGEPSAQVAAVEEKPVEENNLDDAQETSLNLKLKGVYATQDEAFASAVIEHAGKDSVFKIGDKLPGGSNIVLKRVEPSRIVFTRNGNNEFLELEGYALDIAEKPRASGGLRAAGSTRDSKPDNMKRRVLDKRRNTQVTRKLQELKQQFQEKGPESFKDLVSVSPVKSRDGLEGFRVSPGKDRRLFTQFGFNRGDIITELNGTPLTDPSSLFELPNILNSAQDLTVVVKRGSSEVELQFSLQQMQQPEMLNDRTKTKM